MGKFKKIFFFFSIILIYSCSNLRGPIPLTQTTKVNGDADECEFWIDKNDPTKSLLIGNDKKENGALYLWDLSGKLISKTEALNEPVGVDVRYGMKLANREIDIVVCALRSTNEIKIFEIDPQNRKLIDITTEKKIPSNFTKDTYGICLYKRPSDGKIFAFVSSKLKDNIHQIELKDDGFSKVEGSLVRSFGKNDQKSFVEGMLVDDDLGYVYFSDETSAILKYVADPDKNDNSLILKFATQDGIKGDREGLALYKKNQDTPYQDTGYLILSSQGNSSFKIYQREGNNKFIKTISSLGVKNTDGIAATNAKIEPKYPNGLFAAHNSKGKNFVIYNWNEFFGDFLNKKSK
ncbi:MAG: 3-phytase [Candidatus Anoxychlamydiales bacterium]|nr:3-phytase [Candidatus Anoxychlamydiales bacterium]